MTTPQSGREAFEALVDQIDRVAEYAGRYDPNVPVIDMTSLRKILSGVAALAQKPAAHPAITHCDNCGCDWLDNGLNPIGCPYCKQPAVCRCVDCQGDEPGHDPHCPWMRELHTEQKSAPDAYCITREDGECISDDPRCMHNKPAAVDGAISIDAHKATLASLVAAVSLLRRGGRKAAPSDAMFNMMLADYEKAIEASRIALAALPGKTEVGRG